MSHAYDVVCACVDRDRINEYNHACKLKALSKLLRVRAGAAVPFEWPHTLLVVDGA